MEVEDPNVQVHGHAQGTSPLLTSLLKSPSPAPNPGTSILNTINQARTTAPTITNLLTGSKPVTQQKGLSGGVPFVTSTSSTTNYPHQLQTQPLTGPPTSDNPAFNTIQSPSQSAPTLSMLLENKNRESSRQRTASQSRADAQSNRADVLAQDIDISKSFVNDLIGDNDGVATDSPIKDEDQQLMDVFNELIPDNIDDILNPELLEGGEILDNVDDLMDDEEVLQDVAENKSLVPDVSATELQTTINSSGQGSKNEVANVVADQNKPLKQDDSEAISSVKKEILDNEKDIKAVSIFSICS